MEPFPNAEMAQKAGRSGVRPIAPSDRPVNRLPDFPQFRAGDFNFTGELRLLPPLHRELVFQLIPVPVVVVPIANDVVHAATVHDSRQVEHVVNEVTKPRQEPSRSSETWHLPASRGSRVNADIPGHSPVPLRSHYYAIALPHHTSRVYEQPPGKIAISRITSNPCLRPAVRTTC